MNDEIQKVCKVCGFQSNKDDFVNFDIRNSKEDKPKIIWVCLDCFTMVGEKYEENVPQETDFSIREAWYDRD